MAKKKHYEYQEHAETGTRDGFKKIHKLKPNERWRFNPKESYDYEDEPEEYDEGER